MKIKDLDYLELIHVYKVTGLADFLSCRPDTEDFGESLDLYRKLLKNSNKLDEETDKTIRGLHLRHNSKIIRDDSPICSINSIYSDTSSLIDKFDSDFSNYYSKTTIYPSLDYLVSKYADAQNIYINMQLIDYLSNKNEWNSVYLLFQQILDKLFEYSIKAWNQKETCFGIAMMSSNILSFFENYDLKDEVFGNIVKKTICITYLFLTRVIFWPENLSETYKVDFLPITFAHRICALLKRIDVIDKFRVFFADSIPDLSTVDTLIVSDYYFAHELSFALKEQGRKSEFKRDALNKYNTLDRSEVRPYSTCISDGKKDSLELAYRFYLKYIRNEYKLSESQFIALDDRIAKDLLKKQAKTIYKEDSELILDFFHQNGIECFYHFTEKENLDSIRRAGGLFSQHGCLEHSIIPKTTGEMRPLRAKDAEFFLEDYVRLSICERHPLIEGRTGDLVLFKVKVDVAVLDSTLFSDRDAADNDHQHGPNFEDLKKIHMDAVKSHISNINDPECVFMQAQIMAKSFIPQDYINNFDNPICL